MLFEQVCKQLNLLEADYFGLEYQEGSTKVSYITTNYFCGDLCLIFLLYFTALVRSRKALKQTNRTVSCRTINEVLC